ncbi:permease [Opitutaceae bacterium TAV5]|nr:permease [Opitutaceae bacterium TAV5]
MKILQRHIFFSVLFTCSMAVFLFAFILLVGNMLKDLLGYALAGQITIPVLLKLSALLVPYVAAYALPLGILTGVLLVLGRMSGNSEITAMRAAGLGLGFVARPILLLAVAGVVIELGINYYYMPVARTIYVATRNEAVRQDPLKVITPRTFIRDFTGAVIYVDEKDGDRLRDLWVWELDKQNRVVRAHHALSGEVSYNEADNKLVLSVQNGTTEIRDDDNPEDFSKAVKVGSFGSAEFEFSLDHLFSKSGGKEKLSWMTFGQLLAKRQELAAAENAETPAGKKQRMRLEMAFNEKAASSLAVLAFALIGVPLGIKVSRRETSANLMVAMLLILAYYFLAGFAGWLENYPALRPDILVWLPPLAFGAVGVWLFCRIGRMA